MRDAEWSAALMREKHAHSEVGAAPPRRDAPRRDAPRRDAPQKQYADKGLVIIGVSMDEGALRS